MAFPCFENVFDSPTQAIQFKKIVNVNLLAGKACEEKGVSQQKQNLFTWMMPLVFFLVLLGKSWLIEGKQYRFTALEFIALEPPTCT